MMKVRSSHLYGPQVHIVLYQFQTIHFLRAQCKPASTDRRKQ